MKPRHSCAAPVSLVYVIVGPPSSFGDTVTGPFSASAAVSKSPPMSPIELLLSEPVDSSSS